MPILKMKPAVKDYLWGGDRLKKEWHIETDTEIAAEAWMLSCHPDGPSRVVNGEYAGRTLAEAIAAMGPTAVGKNVPAGGDFPILIKLIDARDNLSIQVHPDDAYAGEHEGQFGKTEMWFILDAEPGAFLYYGFREEISATEFRERIRDNTLLPVLNAVPVKKGDVFFIPPGTLHAIGRGILIAEIQQSSNVTYRVYDYDRRDAQGNARQLHIEQALAVTQRTKPVPQSFDPHIADCAYFTVDRITLNGAAVDRAGGTVDDHSFLSVLVIGGDGEIGLPGTGELMKITRGDSVFLPAGSGAWEMTGSVDALLTRI
ncbi:MAG: class I mannose-6-phosphate isomerase [Lachnospiraceae bacterium]|nr:class I mannose-6-phosphate isomerase [Lachnospiraceae bacterium]